MLNDGLHWLFDALDILTPSVYLGTLPGTSTRGNSSIYVTTTVVEAVRLANGKPVLPCTWFRYGNYWEVPPPATRTLLTPADLAIELGDSIAAGAAGALLWGALDATNQSQVSAVQQYVDGTLAKQVQTLCDKFGCAKRAATESAQRGGAAELGGGGGAGIIVNDTTVGATELPRMLGVWGDGLVLQHDAPQLYGCGAPTGHAIAALVVPGDEVVRTTADTSGCFTLRFLPRQAMSSKADAVTIAVKLSNGTNGTPFFATAKNIMYGHTVLCGGQSNMASTSH